MNIDIARARITHPSGIVSPARFVFHSANGNNIGTAAVWLEDRRHRSATRTLYASDAELVAGKTPRHQSILMLANGDEWTINPLSGGCSCRKRNTLLADYSPDQLLEPDTNSLSR